MKRILVAVLAALVLAGCATHVPKASEVRPVPPDRTLAFQSPSDGDATIIVTRDAGFLGSGCYAGLYLDGALVAKMDTGERVTLHVPADRHVLGTWPVGKALCGYREGKDRRETDATLKPNEVRRYRVLIDNGGIGISPTTL